MFVVSILSCVILAAVGARLAKAQPWKGAVLAVAYLTVTFGAAMMQVNLLLMLIAGIVAVGVVAGPLGLKGGQTANIALGCLIGYWFPIVAGPAMS